jgi:hypothetical protein
VTRNFQPHPAVLLQRQHRLVQDLERLWQKHSLVRSEANALNLADELRHRLWQLIRAAVGVLIIVLGLSFGWALVESINNAVAIRIGIWAATVGLGPGQRRTPVQTIHNTIAIAVCIWAAAVLDGTSLIGALVQTIDQRVVIDVLVRAAAIFSGTGLVRAAVILVDNAVIV